MLSWPIHLSWLFLMFVWAQLILLILVGRANGQTTSTSPSVYPFTVRSPYFNAWLETTSTVNSTVDNWPTVWTGHVVGWSGFVRVDGFTSVWQGSVNGWPGAVGVASYLTPTRTIFTIEAGNATTGRIQFNVTYLSPVEPSDWVRQSFPFSYISIDGLASVDGESHSVQFELDTTGEWLANAQDTPIQWSTSQTTNTIYHQMSLATPQLMVDRGGMVMDGTVYLATSSQIADWTIGNYNTTHDLFNTTGALNHGTESQQPQASNAVTMGFSTGNITTNDLPLVWAIGFVRSPAIRDWTQRNPVLRYPFFWSQYSTIGDAIDAFILDFNDTTSRAIALDAELIEGASSVSSVYADLVALSLRQTFGAMDITVPMVNNNSYDLSDVRVYMKDLGRSRRINPVEALYASLPAFLYLNNTLARSLLSPLLEFQASGNYSNLYAAPDLGTTYPDVYGNGLNTEALSVENCGSMLVMVLAHAQKSGDGSLIKQYFSLLKSWADYLVENTMKPTGFVSSDGLNGSNSNLALKGVLGIYAMSVINQVLESRGTLASDTTYYLEKSQNYVQQWKNLASSGGHFVSTFGNQSSWGLLYNFYADKLLGSPLLDNGTFNNQTVFYAEQLSAASQYGISLDSSAPDITRSDWTMFTAASLSDNTTRDSMITLLHSKAFRPTDAVPWPTEYETTGPAAGGRASAAQGAMFSLLALGLSNTTIDVSGAFRITTSGTHKAKAGAIAGGVIGGVALLGLVIGAFLFYRRRKTTLSEKRKTRVFEPFTPGALAGPVSHTSGPEMTSPAVAPLSPTLPFGIHTKRPIPGSAPLRSSVGVTEDRPTSSHVPASSFRDGTSLLRNEVEELRRQMAVLREAQERQLVPPPVYADQV